MYRRSSGAKGNHLAETAGVWKSAAIRQTSLAPADYLKPPLCTPTPTPTISFPKSVARIIKLVEESSGGLLPSPPILVRQPPSPASLCPASFTYAPLRPSDSISLLFSLPLSLRPLSPSLSVFPFFPLCLRLVSALDVSLFSISIFVFTYLIPTGSTLLLCPFVLLFFTEHALFAPTSNFPTRGKLVDASFRIVGRESRQDPKSVNR